jgi:hypothetical protein
LDREFAFEDLTHAVLSRSQLRGKLCPACVVVAVAALHGGAHVEPPGEGETDAGRETHDADHLCGDLALVAVELAEALGYVRPALHLEPLRDEWGAGVEAYDAEMSQVTTTMFYGPTPGLALLELVRYLHAYARTRDGLVAELRGRSWRVDMVLGALWFEDRDPPG